MAKQGKRLKAVYAGLDIDKADLKRWIKPEKSQLELFAA